jgi:hypothetical protein
VVTVVTYLEKWLCKAKKHVTSGVVTRWIRVVTMTEEKTMDFKQIEHSVLKFEPMPDNAPLHEQMCYFALRHLYEDYRRGVVNVQAAHDEKVRLRNAFERAVSTEQTRDMLRDEWQTGLKVSNEFRIRLHKALESGEGIDVLFPLACTCIAAMTGDKTLLGSEVKEKLKARQIRMDDV